MNQYPAALAKVTRPTLPDIFPRKRLFDLLDELRKRPIIWVSGPPGCGKTTLLGSYIETQNIPCLWYNLDEGDSDPATFFYYMGLAAQKATPRNKNSLPLLTPEYLPGISTFTRRYFETLCDQIKCPSLMVFDNYQAVPGEAAVHEVIRTGLSAISEGTNVILVSRSRPPASFIRQKANRMMEALGWDQLRFTLEESQTLLQLNTQKKLSQKTIEILYRASDGWVAGMVLMMESARAQPFEPRQINEMTQRDIFNYFANEVFHKIDETTQAFLLKTACLTEMTGKMAKEITGQSAAGRILSRLNQTHYFTEKRYQEREPVYQYHPLFRDFLLEKAAVIYSPEKLADLRHGAAVLLENANQIEASVGLYRENENWPEITRLIMKHGPLLLKQGRNLLLEKWLSGIPPKIVERNPWLQYWMGVSCSFLNPSRSKSSLERAFELFKERRDANGTFLAWSSLIDTIVFGSQEVKLLDRWIKELESRMDEYVQLSSEEIKSRVTNSMFIALVLRQPQHPDMESWAEETLLVSKKELDENIKALSLFNLAHHRMMSGELDNLVSILYDLNQLAEAPAASPLTQIRAKFSETVYYQAIGSHKQCMIVMKEALKISKTTGIHVMDFWLWAYGAGSALNNCDFKTAKHLFDKMSAYSDRLTSWEMSVYHFLKARETMVRENIKQANVHINLSLELAENVGTFQKRCWPLLLKAHLMHRLQKDKEANEYLEQVYAIALQTKSRLFKFYVNMTKAQFAYDRGNPGDGLKLLRQALSLGQAQQYMNTFVDQPAETAKLCARALEAGIEVAYVQEIIRRRQLIPSEPPVHLENWPWTLKIFTLGRFGLVKDGKPLQFTRKAQEKPLALLKALIAFGGREVHEEQIADALWPEADGDLAHKSVATTLWRLRKLIGYPEAIHLSDRKLTLDARYCWVDAWAFERIIRQAESAWKQGMKENDMAYAISLVQKALDFYQGPFLAAEASAYWAISLRERLQNRFLRTVKRLCEYWKQIGRYENAVECFQRSIEVDDLAEDFYQDLMTCYWQLGRRTDALSIYKRYKETVSTKLGVEPSPEANRLREAIVSELNIDT